MNIFLSIYCVATQLHVYALLVNTCTWINFDLFLRRPNILTRGSILKHGHKGAAFPHMRTLGPPFHICLILVLFTQKVNYWSTRDWKYGWIFKRCRKLNCRNQNVEELEVQFGVGSLQRGQSEVSCRTQCCWFRDSFVKSLQTHHPAFSLCWQKWVWSSSANFLWQKLEGNAKLSECSNHQQLLCQICKRTFVIFFIRHQCSPCSLFYTALLVTDVWI